MPSRPLIFSTRTAWDTRTNDLSLAIQAARAAGRELLDLTVSNPTRCGFRYDTSATLAPLGDPAAMRYAPIAQGLPAARAAVSAYYAEHGADVSPDDILLTTSTSEAYSFLFRLLCNPGDQVLVAQPGYPLFDFLADLHDIELGTYPLFHDFGWWIDFAELGCRITPRTRAILLVHPNNPTGHLTSAAERRQLETLCAQHGLALIVDEVFLDYTLEPTPAQTFATGDHPALCFVVSGLSKIAALPQMKVAWLACLGPEPLRQEALSRLEIVADTFLSLNAPAQHALPAWLANRGAIARQIHDRVRANLDHLRATLASEQNQDSTRQPDRAQTPAGPSGLRWLPVEAGWTVVLRAPAYADVTPETLVREAGIIVHPGAYYGFAGTGWLVLSTLVPEADFRAGLERLATHCEAGLPSSGSASGT